MDINDLSPEELRILEQLDAEEAANDAFVFDLTDDVGSEQPADKQRWDFEFPAVPTRCNFELRGRR